MDLPPLPKYARWEFERRWRVLAPPDLPATSKEILDRYLTGTNLRLRQIRSSDGLILKLGRKHTVRAGCTAITNIYLSAAEYELFANLPAVTLEKRRYSIAGGVLDLVDGHWLFEREYSDMHAMWADAPPPFVAEEVTEDPHWTGFEIARRQAGLTPSSAVG